MSQKCRKKLKPKGIDIMNNLHISSIEPSSMKYSVYTSNAFESQYICYQSLYDFLIPPFFVLTVPIIPGDCHASSKRKKKNQIKKCTQRDSNQLSISEIVVSWQIIFY